MKRRTLTLLATGAAMLLLAGDHWPGHAGAANSDPATPSSLTANAPNQVFQIDPATGQVTATSPPTGQDLQTILGESVSTSGEGLVVTKSPVAGGGVMMNLQGRFRNASIGTVDAHGKLHAECVSGSPADGKTVPAKGRVK